MHTDGLDMKKKDQPKNHFQLVWAGILMSTGIAVLLEIPRKMSQLVQLWQSPSKIWAARICFYLMGILLIGGGIRKLIQYFQSDIKNGADITENDESDR
jgi:hypothetical protein